jgi:SAM-dependent methyltransferase
MKGLNDWMAAARTGDDDDLREAILTGFKAGKPFTPYVPTIALPAPVGSVLDFGCGLGRNFPYLRSVAHRVTGFDLPTMIERCRTLAPAPADELVDDWADVRKRRFDLVFVSLVLQHVEPGPCAAYLRDFAALAPAVYLITRTDTDFGENVLALAADTGLFELGDCVEVDHDEATHQLRVLQRAPFNDARHAGPGRHWETLLRTA